VERGYLKGRPNRRDNRQKVRFSANALFLSGRTGRSFARQNSEKKKEGGVRNLNPRLKGGGADELWTKWLMTEEGGRTPQNNALGRATRTTRSKEKGHKPLHGRPSSNAAENAGVRAKGGHHRKGGGMGTR